MALQLDEAFKGHTNNYWKIIGVEADHRQEKVKVQVALYKDAATRTADVMNFVKDERHTFDLTPGVDKDRADLYGDLKTLDKFSTAQDV